MVSEIKAYFGVELPLPSIFRSPTIEQLSRVVSQGSGKATDRSLVKVSSGTGKFRLFCIPGTKGNVFTDLGGLARLLEPDHTVCGFQDSHRNPMRIELLSAKYVQEMISMDREGPYFLLGICSGAVVAFEIAQQLNSMRRKVAFLGMVEPSPPRDNPLKSYIDFLCLILRRANSHGGRHSEDMLKLNREEKIMYLLIRLRYYAIHLAVRRYKPKSYPDKIYLYLTNESLEDKRMHRMRWSVYSEKSLIIRRILGTHDSITGKYGTPISEIGMRSLASKLRSDILVEYSKG